MRKLIALRVSLRFTLYVLRLTDMSPTLRRIARYWLPPLIWMGLIFLLSAQSDLPGRPSHWLLEVASNVGHFVGYALLAFWWWRALRHAQTGSPGQGVRPWVFILAFVIAVLYGVSDEYHQSFVPGRDSSPLDLLVDALGAATALGVLGWRGVDTGSAETNKKDTTSTKGTK